MSFGWFSLFFPGDTFPIPSGGNSKHANSEHTDTESSAQMDTVRQTEKTAKDWTYNCKKTKDQDVGLWSMHFQMHQIQTSGNSTFCLMKFCCTWTFVPVSYFKRLKTKKAN